MTFRRTFVTLVLVFLAAGFFYVLSPWVAAFVRHERLTRYIKIRTDYPGCVPGKQAFDSFRCECEFIFEGVKTPGELTFDGSSLHEDYDPKDRTYAVSGTGTIQAASNRVVILSDHISINASELLPDRYSSFHVLIGSDGKLTNSRIDISW
jgi:hypothetical protein